MTPAFKNPALQKFTAQIGTALTLAQVLIQRSGSGWELRHVEDREKSASALRTVKPGEGRSLAQFTATGEFRPLKSAPTLQSGWRMDAADDTELELALNALYPGAVADWHAAQSPNPPVTHYREFAGRQSGMYRITARLSDAQVTGVIQACCTKGNCLKRRLWSVEGLPPDGPVAKSLIPCLEPCAVLLETARQAARAGQSAEN